jgi:CheY-like chemotaxis protein
MASKKILAVDDDEAIRSLVRLNLTQAGHTVETANDGAAALALLDRNTYDLIISDVTMPNMDGLELLAAVRARPALRALPFLLLTAKEEPADVTRGYAAGTDVYLTKPFTPTQLLTWVEKLLHE